MGPPQVDPQTVTVRGASSRVNSVSAVVARVPIDASALNVDRDVDLVAVDGNGNQVPNVEIDPSAFTSDRGRPGACHRTLPVVPQLTGAPAPGYRISVGQRRSTRGTVSGEAAIVSQLQNAPTQPIDMSGRTSDLEAQVGLDAARGVTVSGSDRCRSCSRSSRRRGTQTLGIGVTLSGDQPGLTYTLSPRPRRTSRSAGRSPRSRRSTRASWWRRSMSTGLGPARSRELAVQPPTG